MVSTGFREMYSWMYSNVHSSSILCDQTVINQNLYTRLDFNYSFITAFHFVSWRISALLFSKKNRKVISDVCNFILSES